MHYQIGNVRLTRVEYMTLPVPPELVGLDAQAVDNVSWARPPWSENGQVSISAAAWFVEAGGKRAVIDPVQTVDVLLRADAESEKHHQTEIKQKFQTEGFDPDSIDLVLISHIEDVGMAALREQGNWRPFFPNAKILMSEDQLSAFQQMEIEEGNPVQECWQTLIAQGAVETFCNQQEVLPGLVAEVTGFHCAGHTVFHVADGEATFIGHLAVSPLHMSTGPCEALNEMPQESYDVLHKITADGRLLIGPLWPEPGIGRWQNEALKWG